MAPPRLLTQLRGAVSHGLNRSGSAEQNSSEAPTSPLGDGMRSASSGISALSGGMTPPSSGELPPDAVPSPTATAAVLQPSLSIPHNADTKYGSLPHNICLQEQGVLHKDTLGPYKADRPPLA